MSHSNLSKATASRKEPATGDTYFSLGNLSELCGIEENISFAASLLDEYERNFYGASHEDETWRRFREMLERIRMRQIDGKLNLSIVGEFSTGKSTFINALLRQKLLVSSPIQGTTLTSTIIEHGNEYALEIAFLDRKRIARELFDNALDLRARLVELTTEEALAKRLKTVRVVLPTECFCPDVRIIDTPGTNAIEAWHEEVTIRTLQEQSDISIVLVTADRLVTNTVLEFVKSHLQPVLPQCVFVVTHIDNIETESERKRQLDYIKKKIKSELALEDPLVLPYASTLVLNGLRQTKVDSSDATKLVNTSLDNEKLLRQHTVRMRLIVQAKSLMHLIDELYGKITKSIQQVADSQREKLELLLRAKKEDFRNFIAEQESVRKQDFLRETNAIESETETALYNLRINAENRVLGEIQTQCSIDALKEHLERDVKQRFSKELSSGIAFVDTYCSRAKAEFESVINSFFNAFVSEYQHRGLDQLQIEISRMTYPQIARINESDLCLEMSQYVVEQQSKENSAIGAGAIAAAAAAAILTGGFSLLAIGAAAAGAVAGQKLAAPKLEDVRKRCYEGLSSEYNEKFETITSRVVEAVSSYNSKLLELIPTEINRYYQAYKTAIDRLVSAERRNIENVQSQLNQMNHDLDEISERSNRLAAVGKKLDEMSKGKRK